jgi:hypothetical protein
MIVRIRTLAARLAGTRVCALRGIAVGMLAATGALAAPGAHAAPPAGLALSPDQPQQEDTIAMKAPHSRAARTAQTDPALLGRADATLVHVLVKLDYDPVASYEGGVPGLAATSPAKTGLKLAQNKAAVDAYTRYVAAYEAKVLARIEARIPTAKVRKSFRTVYGGVAMTLPANRIGDLLAIDGVVAVQPDSLERPTGAASGNRVPAAGTKAGK